MPDMPLAARIVEQIERHRRLHDPVAEPRNGSEWLPVLRSWQAERLRASFAGFLEDPAQRPATEFFLTDIYGDRDFTRRDADIARVMPTMQRLLPSALLETIAAGIELGALTHALDLDMADALARIAPAPRVLDGSVYAQAYREVGGKARRNRQIALIGQVGDGLASALRVSGVATLLRLSRGPARAAGLGELQGFLERGFAAFGALVDPVGFIDGIVAAEKQLSRRLFGGDPDPFRAARDA